MHLGISSYTYTWSVGVPGHLPARPLDAMGLLERARTLGVHWVQVADNLPLDKLSPPAQNAFFAQAEQDQIHIETGTRGIDPVHLRRYLALAVMMKSPILRIVIDRPDHHPSPEETIQTLSPLGPEFDRAGVILAIENHDRFPVDVLARIVRTLGSWTGVCLDTVNSFGALEGPDLVIDTLGPLTVNLHVKDFTIFRASHAMGFTIEGRPAGQGKLDLPGLFAKLAQFGRDPNAILELWTPPEQTLPETLLKEGQWAVQSVAYLRRMIPD